MFFEILIFNFFPYEQNENIFTDIIYATILAYIFYILIESPFNNIFGLLMNRKSQVKLEYLNNNNHITKF